MKRTSTIILTAMAVVFLAACSKNEPESDQQPEVQSAERVYILNEGGMGRNNASLSVVDLEQGTITDNWFSTANGTPLGDTGNDILVTDDQIIMAINGSNIIQFCDLDGKSIAQIESVPNVRRLAIDEKGEYLYATSYAEDGYVAKISMADHKVTGKAATGYEPEGVVCSGGKLYVANTGGYAYLGGHGYEQSISIIDAATMTETKRVDTGMYNLYGAFIQNEKYPRYILVNAAGDYWMNPAGSMIFDCETEQVIARFDFPASYAAQYDGVFYTIGSSFDYTTYESTYYLNRVEMQFGVPKVFPGLAPEGGSADDDIAAAVRNMSSPYGIFMTDEGDVFISDAGNYSDRGTVYRFSKKGELRQKFTAGVCPGHFAAGK